jgi:hypothetical protein
MTSNLCFEYWGSNEVGHKHLVGHCTRAHSRFQTGENNWHLDSHHQKRFGIWLQKGEICNSQSTSLFYSNIGNFYLPTFSPSLSRMLYDSKVLMKTFCWMEKGNMEVQALPFYTIIKIRPPRSLCSLFIGIGLVWFRWLRNVRYVCDSDVGWRGVMLMRSGSWGYYQGWMMMMMMGCIAKWVLGAETTTRDGWGWWWLWWEKGHVWELMLQPSWVKMSCLNE